MTRHTADDYRNCAAAGMTQVQAAQKLGVGDDTVSRMGMLHGIKFKPAKMGRPVRSPNPKIAGMETRKAILMLLAKPLTVGDLMAATGLTDGGVRMQLHKLEKMGFARVVEIIDRVAIWGRA